MTAPLDVVLFKKTPPRVRPLLIILTALALGFICLGVVLTIIGNWPGYSPYGGNPLRIVGPILLAVGVVAFIGVTVDCCVRASKNKPIYEKEKISSIVVAEQQPGVHSYAAKYNEPKSFLNKSATASTIPPSSTSYNTTAKSAAPSSASNVAKNGSGPPPAPPIPAGGIPSPRQSLMQEGYKPLDMQRHWGAIPVEMRQLPTERKPSPKAAHSDLQEASLAALMGQGAGQGAGQAHHVGWARPQQKKILSPANTGGQVPGGLSNADGVQLRKGPNKRPEILDFMPAPVQPVPQAVATGQTSQGQQQPKWGQAAAASEGAANTAGDPSPGDLDKEKSESKRSLPILQIPISYKSDIDKDNEKEKRNKQKKEQDSQQKSKANDGKDKSKAAAQNKGYVTDEDLWAFESTPKDEHESRHKGHQSKENTPKSRRRETSRGRDSSRGRDKEKERERERRDREKSRERGRHHDHDDHKHRSRSQEPKGSRSRDSSRGRSRRSSMEDFNSMNYLSGKPRQNKDQRYTNRAYDPDESTDSSEKRRKERERQREREKHRDRYKKPRDYDNYSEAPSSAMVPSGRYHIPRRHNTSVSEAGTVIDEPLSGGVNPKYTININAQPGSAVQIGFPKGGVPSFRLAKADGITDMDSVSVMSSHA